MKQKRKHHFAGYTLTFLISFIYSVARNCYLDLRSERCLSFVEPAKIHGLNFVHTKNKIKIYALMH